MNMIGHAIYSIAFVSHRINQAGDERKYFFLLFGLKQGFSEFYCKNKMQVDLCECAGYHFSFQDTKIVGAYPIRTGLWGNFTCTELLKPNPYRADLLKMILVIFLKEIYSMRMYLASAGKKLDKPVWLVVRISIRAICKKIE